jgi:hypothetical protein
LALVFTGILDELWGIAIKKFINIFAIDGYLRVAILAWIGEFRHILTQLNSFCELQFNHKDPKFYDQVTPIIICPDHFYLPELFERRWRGHRSDAGEMER